MAVQAQDTVLVVDDDEAKRHAIAKILRKAGFEILEAGTAVEGLQLISEKPCLVILDVKLPDMSGFELCRLIKENPATSGIPVLHISTTFVDIEDRVHGLEGGADGYLTDVLEPIELVATVRALLRARRAEEAAEITSRRWQVTFDAISDGVILLDRGGRIVQVNSAMEGILRKPWSELESCGIHDILNIPPDPESSPFHRMLASRRREDAELTCGDRWLRVTVDPIRDAGGQVKGGLCIASDITDRRHLEEELRRRADELAAADKRKDEFLAMLAHELRNPLAPIASVLALIRMRRSETTGMGEAIDIAERQVKHMARLLDDLLDVSRFTRGNVQLRRVPVELTSILEQAVETSRPLIEAGGHALSISPPASPVWLEGDPTRLAQVVSNLLNNAAKYTDRGGQITLAAVREGDEAVIRVQDNGVGLSAEMLPRVFDLFAQEDRSLDRSQGGLGIGLTLVRSLVQLHGGRITADSPGLGMGSKFTIRLPALPDASIPNRHAEAIPSTPTQPRRRRILVVDDGKDAAWSLAQVIELWGHEVRVAHDGPEAIEAALPGAVDVILLDIGLPGMDGYLVARQIHARLAGSVPILIALTGYGQDADLARSHTAGFDVHLVKPVNLDRLQALLADPELLRGQGRPELAREWA
ncbi:hybrid sensor histidine kinase/response regulator [Aquisphaera insulae]|uniref:hybrid sensor histidine kinase/response regulator n=1 Tax=Aquisphaera insulae TaxID=2712864 RepID=UPI0013EBA3C5|nr:response regulator [Aquisphaera insulae]